MLNKKQVDNFKMDRAKWLEQYIKSNPETTIKDIYKIGKPLGYTRAEIKAARAWHGKDIITIDEHFWRWR